MTFAMSRSVAPGSKILELSKMVNNIKQMKSTQLSTDGGHPKLLESESRINGTTLLGQLKNSSSNKDIAESMLGGGSAYTTAKKKSKKEQTIDAKIEKLLVAYKKHDEDAKKKAAQLELDKV